MVRSKDQVEQICLTYIKEASKVFYIKQGYLFGSYAKGTAKEYSDIDIALVSPDFSNIAENILLKMLFRLARHTDPLIEPVVLLEDDIKNPMLGSVAIDVVDQGKLIYSSS